MASKNIDEYYLVTCIDAFSKVLTVQIVHASSMDDALEKLSTSKKMQTLFEQENAFKAEDGLAPFDTVADYVYATLREGSLIVSRVSDLEEYELSLDWEIPEAVKSQFQTP